MTIKPFIAVACLAAAISTSMVAHGASQPRATEFDKRIQYIMYNPDDVVVIRTRTGESTLIQLEADEYLVNLPTGGLSMGDTGAWTIGVRGNNIFLKPKGPFPDTNINLVTNKRTYAIALVEEKSKTAAVAWQVRFRYPAEPVRIAGGVNRVHEERGPCSDGPKNLNWFKYGDQSLSPTEVWDDGRFTCMRFPTSKALPVPYRYTPDNDLKEALVNFNFKDDVMVIQDVPEEFRLRLGNKVLGIKTDTVRSAPYNRNNTTTGEVRVKLDGQQ